MVKSLALQVGKFGKSIMLEHVSDFQVLTNAVNNNTKENPQHTTNPAGSISAFGHHVQVSYSGAAIVSAMAAAILWSFF